MNTKIIGTGSYLPPKVMTNDELATFVDTNDEWIQSRTGIQKRHIAIEESTADMAISSAERALADAGLTAEALDLIIVATVSSDQLLPSTACQVQGAIGAVNAFAFDLSAACSGFVFALSVADSYIKSGAIKRALVIGVETLSKIVDWSDRSTCVLFGDGGGAAVLAATEENTGILACAQHADGSRGDVLACKNRSNNNPYIAGDLTPGYVTMNGQEVFRFAVKKVPLLIKETLEKANLTLDDIDVFLLHQANVRINQAIAKKLGIDFAKCPVNLHENGNTSAGSLPLLLDECRKNGTVKEGQTVLLAGFGAGLTWGCNIIKL
ncbi:MAG: beta-ketoacyl-ACP synthase III [Lachnospiraceae bacterium]